MRSLRSWWVRLGAVLTAITLAVFVPAAAWAAQTGTYEIAGELARRRPRFRGGLLAPLCCLLVVGVVVILVLLLLRYRRSGRR